MVPVLQSGQIWGTISRSHKKYRPRQQYGVSIWGKIELDWIMAMTSKTIQPFL